MPWQFGFTAEQCWQSWVVVLLCSASTFGCLCSCIAPAQVGVAQWCAVWQDMIMHKSAIPLQHLCSHVNFQLSAMSGGAPCKQCQLLGLATLLEGAGLAFDIQKCSNFQKSIMVVLKL